MRDKLTKRTVEAIEPSLRDAFLWDAESRDLAAR